MIAQVVPLRRLDSDHDWFDYAVPLTMSVQAGSLVRIPFRSQTILGIVWKTDSQPTTRRLKSILEIVRPAPVMTAWQRQACELVAERSAVSLATLVQSVVPSTWPKTDGADQPAASMDDKIAQSKQPGQALWYRDRAAARRWLLEWLALPGLRVLIVPTKDDGQQLLAEAQQNGQTASLVTSDLTPAQYRNVYQAVLAGKIHRVIGTSRALLLPYPANPTWCLDQEEHPAHKQTRQFPFLSDREIVSWLSPNASWTSPAPSLSRYRETRPAPRERPQPRTLWRLDQPKSHPWITPELASQLAGSAAPTLIIVPLRGFARAVICRDCGWSVRCAQCRQPAGLTTGEQGSTRCQHCEATVQLPAQCPRCQGTNWQYTGLGLNRFSTDLQKLWPDMKISTSWPPLSDANVWLGTYQVYRSLPTDPQPSAVVMLSGDALRSWPDFSADERAWQYLARLQSMLPSIPFFVQTYSSDDPFWQRWKQADEATWYAHELAARRSLQLPPEADLWIALHPLADSQSALKALQASLAKWPEVEVTTLPTARPPVRPKLRVMIRAPYGSLAKLAGQQLFPSPWQLDTTPLSWLS